MNDKDILYEAILKAEKNGYKGHLNLLPIMPMCKTSADLLAYKLYWANRYDIIFSHEFAKAFWGINCVKDVECCVCNNQIPQVYWAYHLQQMVLDENRFKYLEKFL